MSEEQGLDNSLPEPWEVNSDSIRSRGLEEENLPVGRGARAFVKSGLDDNKVVVVGPSGSGKTLLLTSRARYLRTRYKSDVVFYPRNESGVALDPYVERLSMTADWETLPGIDIKFDVEDWAKRWRIALVTAALRLILPLDDLRKKIKPEKWKRIGIDISQSPDSALVGRHMEELLKCDADTVSKVLLNFRGDFEAHLDEALANVRIALILDSPDEFFRGARRSESRSAIPSEGKKPVDTGDDGEHLDSAFPSAWQCAQVGLVRAISELRRPGRIGARMHVLASIRAEAWNTSLHSELGKDEGICEFLSYSRDELLAIFEQNVRFQDKKYPITLSSRTITPEPRNISVQKFFDGEWYRKAGIDIPPGVRKEEYAFDALLRHTLGLPRDLMRICRELMKLPPERRLSEEAGAVVNRVAAEKIFMDVKNRTFPVWKPQYDESIMEIHSQFPRGEILREYDARFRAAHGAEVMPPFVYLYRNGLIGNVHIDQYASDIQHFETPGSQSSIKYIELPPKMRNDTFLVHPVLDAYLRANPHLYRYKPRVNGQLIGPGNRYHEDCVPLFFVGESGREHGKPFPFVFCRNNRIGEAEGTETLTLEHNSGKVLLILLVALSYLRKNELSDDDICKIVGLIKSDVRILGWSLSISSDAVFDLNNWRSPKKILPRIDGAFVVHAPSQDHEDGLASEGPPPQKGSDETETNRPIVSIRQNPKRIVPVGWCWGDVQLSPSLIWRLEKAECNYSGSDLPPARRTNVK